MPTPHLFSNDSSAVPDVSGLSGHTLGFIDSLSACEAMTKDLLNAGISNDSIRTFHGPTGVEAFIRLMEGNQWGESAETMLKEGKFELNLGHLIICVRVQNDEDAAIVAEISNQHGGREVTHFGTWIDRRLT